MAQGWKRRLPFHVDVGGEDLEVLRLFLEFEETADAVVVVVVARGHVAVSRGVHELHDAGALLEVGDGQAVEGVAHIEEKDVGLLALSIFT